MTKQDLKIFLVRKMKVSIILKKKANRQGPTVKAKI